MMDEFVDLDDIQPESGNERFAGFEASQVPGVTWPANFSMRSSGLWFDGDENKLETWLSGPFLIEAEARNPASESWSLILSWKDRDGRSHRAVIPRAELAGDGTDIRKRLADGGLTLAGGRSCKERFLQALISVSCAKRVTLSDTTGWREGSFVLPDRTIGPIDCEPVLFQGRGIGAGFHESGSLAEWQKYVGTPAGEHHRIAFALAVALTGPLLEPLGLEGGGFHLFGPSSCGKTTGLKVAGSAWGGGSERGFTLTWRTTANALEGVAAAHNHTFLPLDEISQISPQELDHATYALGNGQAKARMRADGEIRPRARWRVPILSSGEVTVATRIREAAVMKRVRAGQEVRLVDVLADAGSNYGIFDHAGEEKQASLLSQALQNATDRYYGTAGPAFVERLIEAGSGIFSRARTLLNELSTQLVPEQSDGQVRRVGQRFALVGAAGELAIELGVLPWSRGTASDAVQRTFSGWLTQRGGCDRREDHTAIETVSHFLQRFGEARFIRLDHVSSLAADSGRFISDLAGWRRGEEFLIQPAAWQEITEGLDSLAVAEVLVRHGYLKKSKDGKNSQALQICGRKRRVYVVAASLLGAGAVE
ncbi:DUF927 domain-containing protein [Microvirga sp. RSM25]|uniref:DUF927 domain-containing protein n=1 Tax=Microvirga sp. RSM25 TaxID=3273802 RepID=UPI00384D0A11